MFHPKVIIFTLLIVAGAVFVVWVAMRIIARITGAQFKCPHCKKNRYSQDRDDRFAENICKSCGEHLVPHNK